ncbi:MAG: VRR-NUC domain-containing protein [Hahellaceae bacterium]|nr:VRR-NUC domain-containing protein [Hahellaceae bacterium]
MRNLIARQLERWGQPALAYSLYQQTRLPPARERTARILFNDRAWLDCYHLCLEMQREPRDESESFFAERQLPRCLRKLGLPPEIIGKPKPVKIGSLTLIQDTRLTIEQQVAATFTAMGTDAFHVENWLFNALFGLLFWDTIFMPVRGAFMHPFQIQPHDLYHAEFHPRRHAELDTTLAQVLTASDLDNRMLHAWQQHYGTANPFVGWTENGEALLARALATIPRTHLQAIFRRLLSNLRHNSSGFPDLIRFTEDGGYELIEIKGPGDQIRANQNAWLSFFEQEGIPASILRVEWQA